jgi:hypothetical protein
MRILRAHAVVHKLYRWKVALLTCLYPEAVIVGCQWRLGLGVKLLL